MPQKCSNFYWVPQSVFFHSGCKMWHSEAVGRADPYSLLNTQLHIPPLFSSFLSFSLSLILKLQKLKQMGSGKRRSQFSKLTLSLPWQVQLIISHQMYCAFVSFVALISLCYCFVCLLASMGTPCYHVSLLSLYDCFPK